MSTFAQREHCSVSVGGDDVRRTSIQTAASTATKTDLESVRYAPADSGKTRKIKFIFRVR